MSQHDVHRTTPLMSHRKGRGFTLVELLVIVIVVAILAAIALPAYFDQTRRARRSSVEQFMLDIANREEQYRLDVRSYAATIAALNLAAPADIAPYYTVAIATSGNDCALAAVVVPAYVITATAIGTQASDGNLCLDNLGQKTPAAKWQR